MRHTVLLKCERLCAVCVLVTECVWMIVKISMCVCLCVCVAALYWRLPPRLAAWKRTEPVIMQCSTAK